MVSSQRRAVITGLGIISPIGLDSISCWQSLSQLRSGIKRIESFDAGGLPVRIAGEIVGFDAKKFVDKKDRKSLRVMARSIQLAVAAAQLALNDSKIDKDKLDPTRFGVEFGAGLIASELQELADAARASANCRAMRSNACRATSRLPSARCRCSSVRRRSSSSRASAALALSEACRASTKK